MSEATHDWNSTRARWLSLTVVLLLVAGGLALPGQTAQAGMFMPYDYEADVDNLFDTEVPTFSYEYTVTPTSGWEQAVSCETDIALFDVDDGGAPLETTIVLDETDDTSGTFSLPDLGAGEYELGVQVATCTVDDDGFTEEQGIGDDTDIAFARLLIDKQVEGHVPPDTQFTVEVACEQVERSESDAAVHEREFGADGGTATVLFYDVTECSVTEPEDGGAESVAISDPSVSIEEPTEYDVTVTNTFPEAEEEEEEPEEEEDEEPEAEPAEPVEDEPDYTG